jgi:hypothetical protein
VGGDYLLASFARTIASSDIIVQVIDANRRICHTAHVHANPRSVVHRSITISVKHERRGKTPRHSSRLDIHNWQQS